LKTIKILDAELIKFSSKTDGKYGRSGNSRQNWVGQGVKYPCLYIKPIS